MARDRQPTITRCGRIQPTPFANVLVYLGASPQTPIHFGDGHGIKRIEGIHPKNLSSSPPPYGGEQGRKGKGYPNPAKGQSAVPQAPHGGAAVSIGDVETITVQRLSVHGCDPTVLRSEGLCEALERFHCGLYPQNPPIVLSDA